ncbi:MAG: SIS domain-containing protein [Candidatus Cloacimonetes bacterium]|jgi:D-sedoheptulose 7-phosphate isomerase|nr:SIS domain-containing protein [Candidatus Cloacimonadota bacterium]MDY0299340.1 SIS domain-containing protein [Candidatus Cloacimonadaceae bacterium]MCK9332316.1 SIS domain-containing protein [Candidatus Cloacimonadota bacterium]MDD2210893.1 SIS domain-containing protein [Candidatus Cloacimonadota bacterium]MDD3282740.1 SIS domain-containing protein [Candidatus Cloacimonadota bacterium]
MIPNIKQAFTNAQKVLESFMQDAANQNTIAAIADQLVHTYRKKGKVIVFGNGGSMCDAMHFAEELTGRFHQDREALPAIAISDPSHITCVGNDYGFDFIFSRGVEAYAQKGDVVIGLSTSGNSENVWNALRKAQSLGCITVALLGGNGGKISGSVDYQLIVPASTSDRVQEIHTMVLHILVQLVENELFILPHNTPQFA